MSQTVFIKVVDSSDDGNVKDLAASFYRYKGYTSCCVELLSDIGIFIDTEDMDNYKDKNLYAIRMLEDIGGRLEGDSFNEASHLYPEEKFEEISEDEISDDIGCIVVCDKDIKWYEEQSEFKVIIDISNNTIKFGVVDYITYEKYESDWSDGEDPVEADFDIDFGNMSFDELEEFEDFINDNAEGVYFTMYGDDSMVYYTIE